MSSTVSGLLIRPSGWLRIGKQASAKACSMARRPVCVCVCVCVWGGGGGGVREKERERESVCVCNVCNMKPSW